MSISTLRNNYKKIKLLVHQLGVSNTCLYLVSAIGNRLGFSSIFTKYYFVAQQLEACNVLPLGKGKGIQIREIEPKQIELHPCPRPLSVIADRYNQGGVCLAAYKQEAFTGCLWFVKNQYKEDEVRCAYVLPDFAVWDFDVYVDPNYRMSMAFLKLWESASFRLIDEGYHWSLSRISAFNPNSLSSHKRMGARIIGWAVFVKMGGNQLAISSIKPFVHFSGSELTWPVFKFNLPKI